MLAIGHLISFDDLDPKKIYLALESVITATTGLLVLQMLAPTAQFEPGSSASSRTY